MSYRVRFTTPDDVPQCTALSRDAMLLDSRKRSRRVNTWLKWLQEGSANSAVVVDEAQNIVAFGLIAYVRDDAVWSIRVGRHCVGTYIHDFGKSCVYSSPQEVIKAHRGEGVNLLGFYGWRTDLPSEDAKQVGWLLLQSFLYLHRGLHLKSFTKEVYGEEELSHYMEMGCQVFRTPEQFPDNTRRWRPYIVGADRQEMLQTKRVYTHLFGIFRHDAPALHLRDSQLKLIQLAYLLGLSDQEITEALKTQETLVHQRWCRLYDTLDKAGIRWHHSSRSSRRYEFLQFIDRHREIAFPLVIGRWFYQEPALARRFLLPVE